jgi:hypothetical protein
MALLWINDVRASGLARDARSEEPWFGAWPRVGEIISAIPSATTSMRFWTTGLPVGLCTRCTATGTSSPFLISAFASSKV